MERPQANVCIGGIAARGYYHANLYTTTQDWAVTKEAQLNLSPYRKPHNHNMH